MQTEREDLEAKYLDAVQALEDEAFRAGRTEGFDAGWDAATKSQEGIRYALSTREGSTR